MPKYHVRTTLFYELPNSTQESRETIVESLKSGLEKLAEQIPHLTGRVVYDANRNRGTLKTTGSDDGIVLVTTGVDEVRSDFAPFVELKKVRFAPWKIPENKTYPEALVSPMTAFEGHDTGLPACIFQLTFIEGGLIVGMATHHLVVDGTSVDLIIQAWAAQCRGTFIPVYTDRSVLLGPNEPDYSRTSDLEQAMIRRGCMVNSTKVDPENPWTNFLMSDPTKAAIVRFSAKSLRDLQAKIKAEDPTKSISTADCLQAICWKALTKAKLQHPDNENAKESWSVFPITFRSHRIPEVPQNYIGNCILMNGTSLPVEELQSDKGAVKAAMALRSAVERVDSAYLKEAIAWVNDIADPNARTFLTSPPKKMDCGVTSWAYTKYAKWDFGFGLPTAVRPPNLSASYMFILPARMDLDSEPCFEAYIAATDETHRLLLADKDFQGYLTDYYLESQDVLRSKL